MALLQRKIVRDAILACLSAGFNAAIATLAPTYEVDAFELDFTESSQNVWIGRVNPEEVELSSLMEFPGMTIYTDAVQDGSPRIIHGFQFSGALMGCVDVYIRPREGRERFDSEAMLDMAEDAILGLFGAYTWPATSAGTVIYSRRATGQKGRLVPLADGFGQSVSVQAQFEVVIP
jgi:hypothetical protein